MVFSNDDGDRLQADHYCGLSQREKWGPDQHFIMAKKGAAEARLVLRPSRRETIRVDSVEVSRASPRKVLAWIEEIYSSIPPVDYSPPEERWQYMQKTISKLENGKPVKIVLLGDSIVNDAANSHFQLLLERNWNAHVTTVSSVGSGRGCQYYQQKDRVKEYVTSHEPDLLIIGGISHQFDSDPVKRVIRSVREHSSADIMVMSSAAGRPHPERQKFARELRQLAENLQVEYLNMRMAWDTYIDGSGQTPDRFMRDPVHANARGKQVMGRILARYLSP
ncbi:MAG: SGNH/GDSL hydrolase family protein [Candidatus Brocadiia bacterium]